MRRRRRSGPDSGDERGIVAGERPDLRVDVGGRVAAARAGAECGYYRDRLVDAGEHRRHRRVRLHERHFPLDEIAEDLPAVLGADGFETGADDGGRNAKVQQFDGEVPGLQRAHADLHVTHAVGAIGEWNAEDARADADGIAGADRRVDDSRARRRRTARCGGTTLRCSSRQHMPRASIAIRKIGEDWLTKENVELRTRHEPETIIRMTRIEGGGAGESSDAPADAGRDGSRGGDGHRERSRLDASNRLMSI